MQPRVRSEHSSFVFGRAVWRGRAVTEDIELRVHERPQVRWRIRDDILLRDTK